MKRFPIIRLTALLLLLAGCANARFKRERGDLLCAIDDGNLQQLKLLVEKGYDIDRPDASGNNLTPIMWTIYYRQTEEFNYLLNRGVDINQRDRNGWTALVYAIIGGDDDRDFVEALIKHGADVNAKDNRGASVLSYAKARPPAPKIVALLQQAGARE